MPDTFWVGVGHQKVSDTCGVRHQCGGRHEEVSDTCRVRHRYGLQVDVELEPEQPEEVARAVAELLQTVAAPEPADPWWQAGLDDDLAGDA